jgi:hypothetical protein
LKRKRRQLDSDNQNIPAGMGFQVVRGSTQSHGASGTAEFGERHAAHIRAKTHEIDEVRVKRGNHESGARNGDDQIHFIRAESGTLQTFLRGLPAELNRMLHVFLIGLGKGAWLDRVFDGKDGITLLDLRVVDDGHHGFQAPVRNIKDATHVVFHVVASNGVRRKRRGRCGNRAVRV